LRPLDFLETPLAGCLVVESARASDERGHFARTFCAREFAARGLNATLAQSSLSFNARSGTLRGLHFQGAPAMEDKLVRCDRGAVFDVAVDLRRSSPTFGRWHAVELSADNGRQFYIPKGFAHGFQTLADDTLVAYHITEYFRPELAAGVLWNDPDIGVAWPAPPQALSPRDLSLPRLAEIDRSLLPA
jgi:dTDP-4-dehydrorhamnose 3,5-epimerase